MADNSTLLHVQDLNVSFGQKGAYTQVTHGLNFTLQAGQCLGIVGESGSGKSVTSLSILDLLTSNPNNRTTGNILYNGHHDRVDLLHSDNKTKESIRGKTISMIFQEPMSTFNPVRRCGPQVKEVLDVHNIGAVAGRKAKVLEYFKRVTLPEVERIYNSYPHELSGGQLQRVSIAMALVGAPDIVICDEPTTALDVTVQREIIQLLKEIVREDGLAMIFVSHDLDVVASLCDEVLVMYQGVIVERGPLPDTFISPQHLYTQALLRCKPTLSKQDYYLPTVKDILNGNDTRQLRHEKMADNDNVLVRVQGLSMRFPKKKKHLWSERAYVNAVNEVSFLIKKGATLGIVGESGSGKSTVANCIAGLLMPTEGIIEYNGDLINKRILNSDTNLRREIQLVFQDPYSSLNPSMTVGAAVAEPIRYHKLHTDVNSRVNDLFDQVGLDPTYQQRYPHQLSGGQRQRVCIARALAVEPKLLICDESVSALDVSVQAQILNLLDRLQYELNLTMLFISHDLSVVSYICDEVLVMQHGKIVEQGKCHDIIANPQENYTKSLIDSIPKSINAD